MKPVFIKISLPRGQSFSLRIESSEIERHQLHGHKEIELIYSIQNEAQSIPENKYWKTCLDDLSLKSDNEHININEDAKAKIIELLHQLRSSKKMQDLGLLLQILTELSELSMLSKSAIDTTPILWQEIRLNKIYTYTKEHFNREITLKEIAGIVYMAPHSFCRYFKSKTKKRYSLFLLEVRIDHACKLLTESSDQISEVAFKSGFVNYSNFARLFKRSTGKTPSNYRKTSKNAILSYKTHVCSTYLFKEFKRFNCTIIFVENQV